MDFKVLLFPSMKEDGSENQTITKQKYHTINVPKLRQLYRTRIDSQPYKKLLQVRQQLPVYHHRNAILEKVRSQDVVVIAGETGSGKSTQIPQFMLEVCVVAVTEMFCIITLTKALFTRNIF